MSELPVVTRISYEQEKNYLPERRLSAHKGDHGHVLIVGAGDPKFGGAVCLAGTAALRSGAGLVSCIVAPPSMVRVASASPELMISPLNDVQEASVLLSRSNVVVLGPGLSDNEWGEKWFDALSSSSCPMVIDADGLNWLAKKSKACPHAILTPHPGEAARLLGTTIALVQQDRLASAKALQAQFGATIVLKGAGTIVVSQQGEVSVLDGAAPALATAGTGDVLSGIIGGLLAQGLIPEHAARLAVVVHYEAAKIQQTQGCRGMLASDLFPAIRLLLNPQRQ